jgi:hypothetical protein
MIVTRIYSGQLERWTAYGAITLRNTGQSGIYGVASDPDGASVVALGASPDVAWVRWDRRGERRYEIPGDWLESGVWTGPREVLVGGSEPALFRLDLDTSVATRIELPARPTVLERAGNSVFVGTEDGRLLRRETDALLPIARIQGVLGPGRRHDGARVATQRSTADLRRCEVPDPDLPVPSDRSEKPSRLVEGEVRDVLGVARQLPPTRAPPPHGEVAATAAGRHGHDARSVGHHVGDHDDEQYPAEVHRPTADDARLEENHDVVAVCPPDADRLAVRSRRAFPVRRESPDLLPVREGERAVRVPVDERPTVGRRSDLERVRRVVGRHDDRPPIPSGRDARAVWRATHRVGLPTDPGDDEVARNEPGGPGRPPPPAAPREVAQLAREPGNPAQGPSPPRAGRLHFTFTHDEGPHATRKRAQNGCRGSADIEQLNLAGRPGGQPAPVRGGPMRRRSIRRPSAPPLSSGRRRFAERRVAAGTGG